MYRHCAMLTSRKNALRTLRHSHKYFHNLMVVAEKSANIQTSNRVVSRNLVASRFTEAKKQ